MEEAKAIAQQFGCAHVLIESHELENPDYQANTPLRCYFCKHEVYGELVEYARQHDFQFIIDGTNLDDLGDIRPGRKAAAEYGVRSPLIEAQFTKQDVRDLARALGIPNWDKPSAACLSSRIPHGTPVTIQLLSQVEQAEMIFTAWASGRRACGITARSRGWKFRRMISSSCWVSARRSSSSCARSDTRLSRSISSAIAWEV